MCGWPLVPFLAFEARNASLRISYAVANLRFDGAGSKDVLLTAWDNAIPTTRWTHPHSSCGLMSVCVVPTLAPPITRVYGDRDGTRIMCVVPLASAEAPERVNV